MRCTLLIATFSTLLAALSLLPACDRTEFRQSSLVPVSTMPPPVSRRSEVDLYVGDSLVTILGTPERRPNERAGLWLPRHQLDGALSVRLNRFLGLRLLGGAGLPVDATAAAPTTMPQPQSAVGWGGVGFFFDYVGAYGIGIELEVDASLVLAPSVMQRRDCRWDSDAGWFGGHECAGWSDFYSRMDTVRRAPSRHARLVTRALDGRH